jgi:hypothetical protein
MDNESKFSESFWLLAAVKDLVSPWIMWTLAGEKTGAVSYQRCQMVHFQTKNPNLGKFWRGLNWTMLLFIMDIWTIIRTFVIFNDRLVHFAFIWYSVSGFGAMHREKSGSPVSYASQFPSARRPKKMRRRGLIEVVTRAARFFSIQCTKMGLIIISDDKIYQITIK